MLATFAEAAAQATFGKSPPSFLYRFAYCPSPGNEGCFAHHTVLGGWQ